MDLTAKVPNEVLLQVFQNITSISHKFKLAAVNQKFRHCIITGFQQPQLLNLDFEHQLLNSCKVPMDAWSTAVEAFASKAQITSINVSGYHALGHPCPPNKRPFQQLEAILNILFECGCHGEIKGFKANGCCAAQIVEPFIAKCDKLSELDINFPICSIATPPRDQFHRHPMELGTTLNQKPLTVLNLTFNNFSHDEILLIFRSIKPNTLKKVKMIFHYNIHPLNMSELVRDISDNAWAALEELKLHNGFPKPVLVTYDQLFLDIHRLPSLHHLHISDRFSHLLQQDFEQFYAGILSLFEGNGTRTAAELFVQCDDTSVNPVYCCVIAEFLNRIQLALPDIELDGEQISDGYGTLEFVCGSVSLKLNLQPYGQTTCDDDDCLRCRSFYPLLVHNHLRKEANKKESGHLENCNLDRCRIDNVAHDFNLFGSVLKVIAVETDARRDQVKIWFDSDKNEVFYITLNCGHCLNNSCFGCLCLFD